MNTIDKMKNPFSAIQSGGRVLETLLLNPDKGITKVYSRFKDLDRTTNGFGQGDVIVVAARPAMGSTALLLSMALNCASEREQPVLVFSFDCSAEQIMLRLLSVHAQIPIDKIRFQNLGVAEKERLSKGAKALKKLPIYICDKYPITFKEMESYANHVKKQHGLQLAMVDNLQMLYPSPFNRSEIQEQVVIDTMSGLKDLAKNLAIPVLVSSKLSKLVETRKGNKVPILSDFDAESAIPKYADKVLFLYRAEYYGVDKDFEGNSTKGIAEVIVAKNRNGAVATRQLKYISQFTAFGEIQDGN